MDRMTPVGEADPSYGSRAYRWYVLAILTFTFTFFALDRSLPGILVEPIRREFHLNDKELGLFTGMSFGLGFGLFGLPLGMLADRTKHRRNLLALLVALWSVFTAFGGLARSFFPLLVVRFGLGAAESGTSGLLVPMLTDIVPPARRALATGVLFMSQPVGGFLAGALGGYVAAHYGWRGAFLLAGIPGLTCALLLFFTVRQPARGVLDAERQAAAQAPPTAAEVIRYLIATPSMFWLIIGCASFGFAGSAFLIWISSFYIRVHGLSLAQAGLVLGVGGALFSTAAPALMGWLADRLATYDPRWRLRVVWLAGLASMLATWFQLFTPSVVLSIIAFVVADLLRAGYSGPLYALMMSKAPVRMRGLFMAMTGLIAVVFGFGLGPVLTGALSDWFGGGANIKYAMAVANLGYLWAALTLILASRGLFTDQELNARGKRAPQLVEG